MDSSDMEASPVEFNPPWLAPLRRYVPLLVWVMVILTLVLIPLKIMQYGFLPGDDALRSAGKAVSGKTWHQVLVLSDAYQIDHEFGWSLMLSQLHAATHADPDGVVFFSVAFLFVLAGLAAMLWLRYPEAWLATLTLSMITVLAPYRFLQGRPYVISVAALLSLLLLWRRGQTIGFKRWMLPVMTGLIAASVFMHGPWYLWVLPIAAFFLAGQFRWGFALAGCWVAGAFLGGLLTGHPLGYLLQGVRMVQLATGKHLTQGTMVAELQPQSGDTQALYILGGLLILRRLTNIQAPPLWRDPAFWLACMCWTLSFRVARFWLDWGWPSLMVLMACDLQAWMGARLALDSFRRLTVAAILALIAFMAFTSDVGGRWTGALRQEYLTADNPDLAGWLPEKDGIFYASDMTLFYQTFFKNPHGDWRYILGFEPAMMPAGDFAVYHNILWNYGDAKAYEPWVRKMKPADRLVIRGGRGNLPNIPQLEWNYGVSGLWVGRLPGFHTNGAPVTVPASTNLEFRLDAPTPTNSPAEIRNPKPQNPKE